ncbi:MAG: DUF4926 domain-containing protein [Armatimonadota bacterium]
MRELDLVVPQRGIDEHGLKQGDVGTIVHCCSGGEAFEVEVVTVERQTIAVMTLTSADIRPFKPSEIFHVRELTTAR